MHRLKDFVIKFIFGLLHKVLHQFSHYDVILRWHCPIVYVIFRDFLISRKRYKLGTCNLRQSMQNNRFPIRVQ